jgi:hypothetical protein
VYDKLDYAKMDVIDCKPMEEEILEELLNIKKYSESKCTENIFDLPI